MVGKFANNGRARIFLLPAGLNFDKYYKTKEKISALCFFTFHCLYFRFESSHK